MAQERLVVIETQEKLARERLVRNLLAGEREDSMRRDGAIYDAFLHQREMLNPQSWANADWPEDLITKVEYVEVREEIQPHMGVMYTNFEESLYRDFREIWGRAFTFWGEEESKLKLIVHARHEPHRVSYEASLERVKDGSTFAGPTGRIVISPDVSIASGSPKELLRELMSDCPLLVGLVILTVEDGAVVLFGSDTSKLSHGMDAGAFVFG